MGRAGNVAAATAASRAARRNRAAAQGQLRASRERQGDIFRCKAEEEVPQQARPPQNALRRPAADLGEEPSRYLLRFGFLRSAEPQAQQALARPRLGITIEGHEEEESHTLYLLSCSLKVVADRGCSRPSGHFSSTAWTCKHRLCDMRDHLHDTVKEALGPESYEAWFVETPFARHGGVPGTSARLKNWLTSLAACLNSGALEAEAMAEVLRFLGAPVPEDSDARLKRFDEAALRAQGRCVSCTLPIDPQEETFDAGRFGGGGGDGRVGLCARCFALRAQVDGAGSFFCGDGTVTEAEKALSAHLAAQFLHA